MDEYRNMMRREETRHKRVRSTLFCYVSSKQAKVLSAVRSQDGVMPGGGVVKGLQRGLLVYW